MAYLGPHLFTEGSDEIVEPASDVFEIDDFTSPSDWEKVMHFQISSQREEGFTLYIQTINKFN